ncbi:MAG TPA: HNH endonuclease [bacterium]|nr:HNH endonuclease [bacterium]
MRFVTSRNFQLPDDAQEMGSRLWFNLWEKKNWPYLELAVGDKLFWYESPRQRLRWSSTVAWVDKFSYSNKDEIIQRLQLPPEESVIPYFAKAAASGYCLAYKIEPTVLLDVPKPRNIRFPYLGWCRVDDEFEKRWGAVEGAKSAHAEIYPDEAHVQLLEEGGRTKVEVNRYERDRAARQACIEFHGSKCLACGIDMEQIYGSIGRGFIHVHHTTPLSSVGELRNIDPRTDLIPLCPNCHAMIHRSDPPFGLEELRKRIKK